jgi:hypothetical protein
MHQKRTTPTAKLDSQKSDEARVEHYLDEVRVRSLK